MGSDFLPIKVIEGWVGIIDPPFASVSVGQNNRPTLRAGRIPTIHNSSAYYLQKQNYCVIILLMGYLFLSLLLIIVFFVSNI